MTGYSKAQLDWMTHGVGLGQARLNKPDVLARMMTDEQIMTLRWEVGIRQRILDHLQTRLPLDDVMQVVADYMVQHADLQIARYDWRVDDLSFYAQCTTARERMIQHPLVVAAINRLPKKNKAA